MGFTPLDGVPMGTRTGSMDPAVVTYLINQKGMSAKDVDALMNKKAEFRVFRAYHLTSEICSAAAKEGNDKEEHSLLLICSQTKLRKTSVLMLPLWAVLTQLYSLQSRNFR